MFNPEEAKYANGVLVELPYPTDDVRLMTKAAVEAVDRVYRTGFKYSKAEVLLDNLCQKGQTFFQSLNQWPLKRSWACWTQSMADGEGRRCAWRVCRLTRIGGCVGR